MTHYPEFFSPVVLDVGGATTGAGDGLRCLAPEDCHVGLAALLKARLAGDAIGDLTTAGPLIAEPLKVLTLGAELSTGARVSSLAVENLAYACSSCVMVMAGTLWLLAAFTISESLRAASWPVAQCWSC